MRIDTEVTVITGTTEQIQRELDRLKALRVRLIPPQQTSKEEDPSNN